MSNGSQKIGSIAYSGAGTAGTLDRGRRMLRMLGCDDVDADMSAMGRVSRAHRREYWRRSTVREMKEGSLGGVSPPCAPAPGREASPQGVNGCKRFNLR